MLQPENITFVNMLGLTFLLAMASLLMVLPRKYALLPIIMLTCYMTLGQTVAIFGLNFNFFRILVLIGWVRVFLRGEARGIRLNKIDTLLIALIASSWLIYVLLWQTTAAAINKFGRAYDAIGLYFLFRFLVRDFHDILRFCRMTAVLIIPLAMAMGIEKLTGHNAFAIFGGVPEVTAVRTGSLRVQGPFRHPILAGTFGATLFPVFVGLWQQGKGNRLLSLLAVLSCGTITVASASSGPLFAFLSGLLALALWPLRNHMSRIRWGILLTVVGLELVMKAHVWYLMGRVNIVSGSTGFHRAYLIDRAFANLGDWWLIGTRSTADWTDESINLFDVTNQYIAYGADGGLITMLLFILVIVRCFRAVGLTVRALGEESPKLQFYVWALGAALFTHVVTFLSVTYFDQNLVNWYLLLAAISTASLSVQGVWTKERGLNDPLPVAAALGRSRFEAGRQSETPVFHADKRRST